MGNNNTRSCVSNDMAINNKLNPCPACQGNGKFRHFTNVFEDKAEYSKCTMCDGQEHLSDEQYSKFSQADLNQMKTRWEYNHKPHLGGK